MKTIMSNEDLVTLFNKFEFSERQIRKLILFYNRYKENIEILEASYIHYHECMLNLGYDEFDIHELASTYPRAMFQSFKNGALEPYYEKYIEYVTLSSCKLDNASRAEKNRKTLKTLGLTDDKIDYILKVDLPIAEMDPEELLDNIVFYLSCGMSEEELVKCVNHNATVLLFGRKEYAPLFDLFRLIGATNKDFGRMVVLYARLNSIVQAEVMYKTIEWAIAKDIDCRRFVKCLKNNMIRNYDEDELDKNYNDLLEIGFTEEQAINCISDDFRILYKGKDKIEYIIEVGRKYGIDKPSMIKMISGFAQFVDLSEEKIKGKIAVMARYNLVDFVSEHPKNLIEGAELIDARATYLRLFRPELSKEDFDRAIFTQESTFIRRYNRENGYVKELKPVIQDIKPTIKK